MAMLTTPWTKVLLDLWEHRTRTLIVALAIAVGAGGFAILSVVALRSLLTESRAARRRALRGRVN